MSANPHRGEVPVILAGTVYTARPKYGAVVAWEERAGIPSLHLMTRFAAGIYHMKELVAVIHAAVSAGGANLTEEQVGDAVVEAGSDTFLPIAGKLLRHAVTGGKESEPGEAVATEGTAVSPSVAS